MNRLLVELRRLYGLQDGAAHGPAAIEHRTRAIVLALALPADGQRLLSVWRSVQSDLDLPAPAIAVSGRDALQLWFSLEAPMSPTTGRQFLEALRVRYLPDVEASRIRMGSDASNLPTAPCVEVEPDRWSAFVTHDLAVLFAETPWLDVPPSIDGQAAILASLHPTRRVAFEAALERLGVVRTEAALEPAAPRQAVAVPQPAGPARFLTNVMNDETAPLALRIEAARILLKHAKHD